MGPNFDAPRFGLQVKIAQLVVDVATSILVANSVVFMYVVEPFFLSRRVFGVADVATAKCCRDLLVFAVAVATSR